MTTLGKLDLESGGKGWWESKHVKVESTNANPLGLEAQHHLEVRLEMTAIIALKILPSVDKPLGLMLALQKALHLALGEKRSWELHLTSDSRGPEGRQETFRISSLIEQVHPGVPMPLQRDWDIEP